MGSPPDLQRNPEILGDGATIARRLTGIRDPFDNMGAMLVRHVAWRVGEEAGDGTTTTAVMAHAIVESAMRFVAAGGDPLAARRGLEKAMAAALAELDLLVRPANSEAAVTAVATVASGDGRIGRLFGEIYDVLGDEALVIVEESSGLDVDRHYVEGFGWDSGFCSPHFVTDETRQEAVLERPYLLVTDQVVESPEQLLPAMEMARKNDAKSFAVIAPEIRSPAIALLVTNKMKGVIDTLAVRAPGAGARMIGILEDAAVLTGGKALLKDTGRDLHAVASNDLGRAQQIKASQRSFTVLGGMGRSEAIRARASGLKAQLASAAEERDRDSIKERIGKLTGGCAVIMVGGYTELERKEKVLRIRDAVQATTAAIDEGIVPGAGSAYIALIPRLRQLDIENPDEFVGVKGLIRGLEEPCRRIASNGGYDGRLIVARTMTAAPGWGFDALRGEFVDTYETGTCGSSSCR